MVPESVFKARAPHTASHGLRTDPWGLPGLLAEEQHQQRPQPQGG